MPQKLSTPDLEKFTQMRLKQFRGCMPVAVAWMQAIANGRPQTIEEIAAMLGKPIEEVRPKLEEFVKFVGVDCDSGGNVCGLSEKSPEGVKLPVFTIRWLDTGKTAEMRGCALDALCPVLTSGRRAQIELSSGGEPVRITVSAEGKLEDADPPGAVAIVADPEAFDTHSQTRSDCANGLFFTSAQAASGWLAKHPGYIAVPMEFFVSADSHFYAQAFDEGELPAKLRKQTRSA